MRNLAYIDLHIRSFARMFKPGRVFRVVSGLPEDAVFITTKERDFGHHLECLFESESFESVPEGHGIPRHAEVEIKEYQAGLTDDDVAFLRELAEELEGAPRVGNEYNKDDQRLFIELNDRLVRKVAARLRKIAVGWR